MELYIRMCRVIYVYVQSYAYICDILMPKKCFLKDQELFKKEDDLFYCCQYIVNRHSVEVQTFHVYFLWGKSLKYPTLYQAETIYKKRIYS